MASHERRAEYLMARIDALRLGADTTVLEIGRSPLTNLVLARCPQLTTLGPPLEHTLLDKAHQLDTARVPHIALDLNASNLRSHWIVPRRFDLILHNEVVEHSCASRRPGYFAICTS